MTPGGPPRIARVLLRMLPLGERRSDIEDDLMELFDARTASRGAHYAPADPLTFGGALIVLLAASTAAVLLPTWRAAAVDPAAVLREI
jgi:hypothetical protein